MSQNWIDKHHPRSPRCSFRRARASHCSPLERRGSLCEVGSHSLDWRYSFTRWQCAQPWAARHWAFLCLPTVESLHSWCLRRRRLNHQAGTHNALPSWPAFEVHRTICSSRYRTCRRSYTLDYRRDCGHQWRKALSFGNLAGLRGTLLARSVELSWS